MTEKPESTDQAIISDAQLILAEKRTHLAVLRTGIAVIALPLSILSFLIVTSKRYDAIDELHFLLPLSLFCTFLIILGFYLIIHALLRMRHYEQLLKKLKSAHSVLGKLID